jgi:hypothetical protein
MRGVLGVVILNILQVIQPDAEAVLDNLHQKSANSP